MDIGADHKFMARALRLAEHGLYTTDPNPRVGCVLVDAAGNIVGESWHERAGEAHAEKRALQIAGAAAKGATAYVTLEPCCHHGRTLPCTDSLIAAGVVRVVYGLGDPNPQVAGKGRQQLLDAGIEVTAGVAEADCLELNRGFVSRMQLQRPWVRSKLAVSLDGRTALASGESQWITCEAARADVHRWRARSSAVLTGVSTVLADNPDLTARIAGLTAADLRQPLRVVADSNLRTPPAAKLFSAADAPVVIAHSGGSANAAAALKAASAELWDLPKEGERVSLVALMRRLAQAEINEVWVEAGAELNGALLDAGLLDELIVYQAGSILGADARGMFQISPLKQMTERPEFSLQDVRRVGTDVRLRYRPVSRNG